MLHATPTYTLRTEVISMVSELFDKGKNLVIHSNTGELLPDLYESKVKVYRKETKNGKVYMEVGNSERVANEYQIAIYRTMK